MTADVRFGRLWIGGDIIPCPHFNAKIVGRSRKHASAVSSSAYQSGDKLFSEYDQRIKNYPLRNERIIYTEIMLPDHVPRRFLDRETLWNSVEMNENHSRAQYARRFVMALPKELSYEDNLQFVREYCQEQFVSKGMCVDLAYHYDGDNNPHVHILTTMREMDDQGKWLPKSRKEYILDENGERIRLTSGEWKSRHVPMNDWDDHGNMEKWRHAWEVKQNWYLEQAGRQERIDMRSYERQGNDLIPTIHLGPEASAMERRGIRTFLGDINRDIRKHNTLIAFVKKGLDILRNWVNELNDEKLRREEQRLAQGPSVHTMLVNYIESRTAERDTWSSMAKIKGLSKDMIFVKEAEAWMDAHGIFHAADLIEKVESLEKRSREASATISKNDARRKLIAKIQEKADTYAATKPIFDAYSKIWLKKNKEKYAAEHSDELKDHKRAYGFLMKNHGEQLTVDPHEFDAELKRMKKEDAAATAELESIKGQLTEMKKLKHKLGKSTPELNRKEKSIREQIHQTTEVQRKPTTKKKHEQTR